MIKEKEIGENSEKFLRPFATTDISHSLTEHPTATDGYYLKNTSVRNLKLPKLQSFSIGKPNKIEVLYR